jgi:putative membrane protein
MSPRREINLFAGAACVAALISAVGCADLPTWALEASPVFIGTALIAFLPPPSRLLGRLLFVHALVLVIGAHWTYAEVPAGNWVRDQLGLLRNPYDRLGHVFQGLVPCLFFREWFLRGALVASARMAGGLAVACTLAFSAFYELIEWMVAIVIGQSADAFLGTQGDPWDTQADMACALVAALLALLFLSRSHDRSLSSLTPTPSA